MRKQAANVRKAADGRDRRGGSGLKNALNRAFRAIVSRFGVELMLGTVLTALVVTGMASILTVPDALGVNWSLAAEETARRNTPANPASGSNTGEMSPSLPASPADRATVKPLPRVQPSGSATADKHRASLNRLFEAIRQVETNGNDHYVGDNGMSLGAYQIQAAHVQDSGIGLPWRTVAASRKLSERAMVLYWKRFCPEAYERMDYQTLARVHNGGPAGAGKRSTLAYWSKVREAMND